MPSWTTHGPISLQGSAKVSKRRDEGVARLQVLASRAPDGGVAFLSSQAADELGAASGTAARIPLLLAAGSDCVVTCEVDKGLSGACILLTPVQAYNLHTAAGRTEAFQLFQQPEQPFDLVGLDAEVSVLGRPGEADVTLDAGQLAAQFSREYLGRVVAVNEACVLRHAGQQVLLRVSGTNTLEEAERAEAIGYHCFRGRVAPETRMYLCSPPESAAPSGGEGPSGWSAVEEVTPGASSAAAPDPGGEPSSGSSAPQTLLGQRSRVVLVNTRPRPPPGAAPSTVRVLTNDGEEFPVLRRLLLPCIALTKVLRPAEANASWAHVDIDTSTFDRVLLFLEALALGREPPGFGIHLIASLADAAAKLGLRPLEEYCQQRLGAAESRLRYYRLDEIQQLNRSGGCWLMLDGMVLDIGRWLPEHPGGSTIIPAQALNKESARMFEVYHASRESFRYIQQFYCGELWPEDRAALLPLEEPPSQEFLQQLRAFTPFRLPPPECLVCKNL